MPSECLTMPELRYTTGSLERQVELAIYLVQKHRYGICRQNGMGQYPAVRTYDASAHAQVRA